MSILIRGMKMPNACSNCPFVMAYYCLLIGISDDNEVTNYINERHPKCPLVKINESLFSVDNVRKFLKENLPKERSEI